MRELDTTRRADMIRYLEAMRVLLTPEGAWTQGRAARTATGRPCEFRSPRAVCWCLSGAIRRVTGDGRHPYAAIYRRLVYTTAVHGELLYVWNDAPGRTQAEVRALLDDCLAELREEVTA